MIELWAIQVAAVDRFVTRFTDVTESGRFLLTDEVGLGKTVVARGIIDEYRDLGTQRGFTDVYTCLNNEITDQNRGTLCDDKSKAVPGRLTLLAPKSHDSAIRWGIGHFHICAILRVAQLRKHCISYTICPTRP